MSENSEDLGINLDSSVKKLLKAQYPNLNLRAPVVKALSICALKFLEEIVQKSADVCLEKQKNTMVNDHVYEALERMHLSSIINEAKTIGNEIEDGIKKRNEAWRTPKEPKKTDEERIEESKQISEYFKLLKKKRQADEAASKGSET